jgi:hypothetical protein
MRRWKPARLLVVWLAVVLLILATVVSGWGSARLNTLARTRGRRISLRASADVVDDLRGFGFTPDVSTVLGESIRLAERRWRSPLAAFDAVRT